MCVICVSRSGIRQPSDEIIRAMFRKNSHGAGYMYARDGKVIIHKGFMNLHDYLAAIHSEHFTAKDSVVYHFRISTQAGIQPEMTHPFPLTNQSRWLKALDVQCGIGVAHNGVIYLTSDPFNTKLSDTAIFIRDYLTRLLLDPDDLRDQGILDTIWDLALSKFAIMDGSGYVATVGPFLNDRGLLYSNDYFLY